MNAKFTAVAAALTLVISGSAFAENTSGSQGRQEARASADQQKERIEKQHEVAMEKCDNMKGNSKEICKAEADGEKKVAEAQAKLNEDNNQKNRRELAEAKAEAEYEVAKAQCNEASDTKDACQKVAKAEMELAKAHAEMDEAKHAASTENTGRTSGSSESRTATSKSTDGDK